MVADLKNPPSHADAAWKHALEVYFPSFMQFFYPDIAAQIDWTVKPEMLDKELRKLTHDGETGHRLVDKLIKVRLKNGQAHLLLLHVEVQGHYEADFPERLYLYHSRLYDRYRLPVLTLAILADDRPQWRPTEHVMQACGHRVVQFRFLMKKLLDYRTQVNDLLSSSNPFGIVVAAQLAALETRGDAQSRLQQKSALTRVLYEQGLSKQHVLHLYYFLDGVMTLPEECEVRYNDYIHALEEEKAVAFITTAEKIGRKKGMQQGLEQGMQKGLDQGQHGKALEIAHRMFKVGISVEAIKTCTGLDDDDLSTLISVH